MAEKSILDGIPVDDKAFPLNRGKQSKEHLGIVSKCQVCGSPIYGHTIIPVDSEPVVKRSCNCQQQANLGMRTS